MLRACLAAGAAALVLCAGAGAVSPAVGLARQVKASIQSYYAKSGLAFTTVTCKISASRTSALCKAHFRAPAKRALGVFTIRVTETAAGTAETKTLSVSCKDSKTGRKIGCF